MIPNFFNFLAIVLLILTAVKINSQKASIYFRHTSSKAPGETTYPLIIKDYGNFKQKQQES